MSPLFGPILAQLVTLGVGDRTEARYVVSGTGTPGQQAVVAPSSSPYAEVATYPRISLNFGWRHSTLSQTSLTLGYGPSITVTPLEADHPDVLVYQAATFAAAHAQRWQRLTMTISEVASFTEFNFALQALGYPGALPPTTTGGTGPPNGTTPGGTTPGGTTPGGTTGTPTGTPTQPGTVGNPARAANQTVHLATEVTTLSFVESVSPILTEGVDLGYTVSGAVEPSERDLYPIVAGPRGYLYASYRFTRHDTLTSSFTAQYVGQRSGNDAVLTLANATVAHRFDPTTTGSLGGGLSVSRNSQPDGLVYWNVYPTFNTGISHLSRLGRTTLAVGLNAGSAPVLDPIRASVDPRITFGAFSGLVRDRFSILASATTALSLGAYANQGTLNSFNGSLVASYRLGAALSVDSGVRAAWQSFEGTTTIPPSFALFVGVTFGGFKYP